MSYLFEELEKRIGHRFRNLNLLENAMTHSSAAYESSDHSPSNERLEFLGDAVLQLVCSELIYREHPEMQEGQMTELRASLVCSKSLCGFSNEIGLGDFILLGKGESLTGGRTRPSILADAFEALIAAIYLDGGLEPAANFILPFIRRSLTGKKIDTIKDYKTVLQEIIQKNREETLEYVLTAEDGPPHDRVFHMEVHLNSNVIGRGVGKSKKDAAQMAAKEALELMGY